MKEPWSFVGLCCKAKLNYWEFFDRTIGMQNSRALFLSDASLNQFQYIKVSESFLESELYAMLLLMLLSLTAEMVDEKSAVDSTNYCWKYGSICPFA